MDPRYQREHARNDNRELRMYLDCFLYVCGLLFSDREYNVGSMCECPCSLKARKICQKLVSAKVACQDVRYYESG